MGIREATTVLLPDITLGWGGSGIRAVRGRRHGASHRPNQAGVVVTTRQEDSLSGHRGQLPPRIYPNCYQGTGRHYNQIGGNTVPRLDSPDEYGFPTIESPITVANHRLILHRVQGGGAEYHPGGAAATHLDPGIFGRHGARHRQPGRPQPGRMSLHRNK